MPFEDKISEHLLMRGLVSESKLLALLAAAESGGTSLEEAVLKNGAIDAAVFNNLKAEVANLPPADLAGRIFDSQTINLLPAKMRRHYQALIFDKSGDSVKIGLVNPWDIETHEAIEAFVARYGYRAKYYCISLRDFNHAQECAAEAEKSENEDYFHPASIEKSEPFRHDKHHEDKSLDKLLTLIIQYAIEGRAIKVHLEGDNAGGRARFRSGGRLHNSLSYPASTHRGLIARLAALIGGSNGKCRVKTDSSDLCIMANILPFESGQKAVIEMLDLAAPPKNLRSLGFSLAQLSLLKNALGRSGIIIVSSADDLARQEAIYGLIKELDADQLSISAIESQIVHKIPGISQSAINPLIQSRSDLFAAFLDHDVDVVASDEADSKELLALAETAARMGKLVILGIKADSLASAVQSIWKLSGGSEGLIRLVSGALDVKKVKRICRSCIKESRPPHGLLHKAKNELNNVAAEFIGSSWPGLKFFQGTGCPACGLTGSSGTALISEIWPMEAEYAEELIAALLNRGEAVSPSADKYATMEQDGLIKVSYGLIAVSEALARR